MKSCAGQMPVLVGHPFAAIGRGEEIRCAFRAFQAVALDLPLYDIYSFIRSDPETERELSPHVVESLSPKLDLFYINGDEVNPIFSRLGSRMPTDAYKVICPQWELSTYPQEWADQLERFDEIWAPSRFVFDSIQNAVRKPVLHMPLPVQVKIMSFLERRYFQIPESAYVFLFFFDFRSYIDRKNPFAVIEAFEKVCATRPSGDTSLVIKLSGSESSPKSESDLQRFMVEVNQSQWRDRIIIIGKVLNEIEIKNLIRCCDCFVSLHRSEGFGRGIAEAMYLGKPVVATGYSGNLDFMNEENSCLVGYKLIPVEEDQYPYPKGQIWAEPDIDHAVHYMLKLVDDRDYGRKLGQIASRHIRTHFSYRAIGLRYKKRLDEMLDGRGISSK